MIALDKLAEEVEQLFWVDKGFIKGNGSDIKDSRAAFVFLARWEGYTMSDINDFLGRNITYVYSLFHTAEDKMKECEQYYFKVRELM